MPMSHVGLTVSHLPASCSFYLSALQPLGYRYIGQQGNQIGFGEQEADFFICQETQGNGPGPAHVAFAARSRDEVDAFYAAAVKAGGVPHGEPRLRDIETGYYSAAVIDLDKNSLEVVHRENDRPVNTFFIENGNDLSRSHITEHVLRSSPEGSPLRTIVNSNITRITKTTTNATPMPSEPSDSSDPNSEALVGTLLGAAAGAAIAYFMTKEESKTVDSQQPEIIRRTTMRHTVKPSPQPQHQPLRSGRSRRESISITSEPHSQRNVRPRPGAIKERSSYGSESQPNSSYKPLFPRVPCTVASVATFAESCRSSPKPLAVEAPPTVLSDAKSNYHHRGFSRPLAIEAPPTMVSASTRKSHRSYKTPTHDTVHGPSEPDSREPVYLEGSRVTRATRASKAGTVRTTTTYETYRASHIAADYSLPPSAKTTIRDEDRDEMPLPRPRKGSLQALDPHDISLPASVTNGSRYTQEPYEIELPLSTTTDHARRMHRSSYKSPASHRSHQLHRESNRAETPPAPEPVPEEPRQEVCGDRGAPYDSFVSRPRSSARSAASASTVKPLTRGNIRRAATENGLDELDTVLPEDSISQTGREKVRSSGHDYSSRNCTHKSTSTHSRSHGSSNKSGHRSARSARSARRSNGSSRVSMPRSIRRVLEVVS